MKKRNSKIASLVKYIFASAGGGASETLGIFKRLRRKNSVSPKNSENQESAEESASPIKGKISNTPSFKDLNVEKIVSGNYSKFRKGLNNSSKIILIFGKRGSGKSALGLKIMENIFVQTKRKSYALGIDEDFLPNWIESIDNVESAESGSVILVDEGAVSFSSRESMKEANKELSKLMAIARHKNLTLIFITQNTGLIERNVLKLADTLLVKEGSLLQLEMERPEIKRFYEKSKKYFDKIDGDKVSYFYLIDADCEGLLKFSLPSFWSDKLSKNKGSF